MRRGRVAGFALALVALTGCSTPREPVQLREGRPAMGTLLEITIVAPDEATARRWVDGCFERVDRLERLLSSWDEGSDVSRLNRAAAARRPGAPLHPDDWIAVDPLVVDALAAARRFADETGGAFDVSVGPSISLWREAARSGELPTPGQVAAARARTGAARIGLEAGRAALATGMAVDLGGLAKGWALDRVETWLLEEGASRALLNFGGSSLLALGAPPDAAAWRVLVGAGELRLGVLVLADAHASVSASLGQFHEIAGQRFGHVIDPASGWPVNREVVSIAVGDSGAATEAWSTALLVRGEAGFAAATAAGLEVMVVDGETVSSSRRFPPLEWLEPAGVRSPR